MKRCVIALAALLAVGACDRNAPQTLEKSSRPDRFGLGQKATAAQLAAFDIDITPDGKGLPAGRGTAREGAAVYAAKCAVCHGAKGEGLGTFPKLVGVEPRDSFPFGRNVKLVKTIGNYWPYSTTLFDYIRRAMPLMAPGSLTNDEVYGLVAFLLEQNQIVQNGTVIDANSLPKVEMPARKHFVPDNRKGGSEFR